jgi:hypothetical protein
MRAFSLGFMGVSLLLAGCVPDLVDETTAVPSPRVLAIRSTPAEAAEGETVTLDALVAAPVVSASASLAWSLCLDRKPLSELGPVSTRCLASPNPGQDIAEPIDPEPPVSVALPNDACQLFGPERPEPKPGQPSGRPVDPDVTGGFYQPVLAWIEREPVLGGVRLSCPLSGASPETTREFNASYHPNTNPAPLALEAINGDGSSTIDAAGDPLGVAPETRVTLRLHLPSCAPDVESCGGAETYVVYDSLTDTLETRSESLVVSWYATAGSFDEPRSEASPASSDELVASNGFVLPAQAGTVAVWAVARDDRGGVGWLSGLLLVTP